MPDPTTAPTATHIRVIMIFPTVLPHSTSIIESSNPLAAAAMVPTTESCGSGGGCNISAISHHAKGFRPALPRLRQDRRVRVQSSADLAGSSVPAQGIPAPVRTGVDIDHRPARASVGCRRDVRTDRNYG